MARNPLPGAQNAAIKSDSKLVKVRALTHLHEDDTHREPGEIFETTPERAAAIAGIAEPVAEDVK